VKAFIQKEPKSLQGSPAIREVIKSVEDTAERMGGRREFLEREVQTDKNAGNNCCSSAKREDPTKFSRK